MFKFVLQFIIYFGVLLLNTKKKGTWYAPSNFIFALYALCAFLGIPTISLWEMEQSLSISYLIPTFLFVLATLFFISPFWSFNETSKEAIKLPDRKILDLFSNFIIILSWYSILYYSSYVVNLLTLSDLGDARVETAMGTGSYTGEGIWNTIASVAASLNIFAILLFFIYYVIGGSPIRILLLLGASLSEPIQVLTFIGRDGIVFWVFAFSFCYLLFRPYMNKQKKRGLIMTSLPLLLVLFIPFTLISSSRFDESDYGTFGSFVCYLGQGFISGPLLFGIDNIKHLGGANFPLFFEIIGKKVPSDDMVQIGEWKSWSFNTSVGSFYYDLGTLGLILILLCFLLLFYCTVQNRKSRLFYFHTIIIYLLYFRLIAEGVFYFREHTRGGNLMILLVLFLSYFFSVIGYKKGVVLYKNP